MHFLNLDGMIDDLKADRLTESDYFKYLVGYFALLGFPTEIFFAAGTTQKTASAFQMLLGYGIGMGLLFWFLSSIYRANRGEYGKGFFVRYFLLSWVVGLRSAVVSLPLIFVVSFVTQAKLIEPTAGFFYPFLAILIVSAIGGIWYYILKMHSAFRALAQHDKLPSLMMPVDSNPK